MQSFYDQLLAWEWAGNSGLRLASTFVTFIALLIFFRVLFPFFLKRLTDLVQRTRLAVDDVLISTLGRVPGFAWTLLSLLIAVQTLVLPDPLPMIIWAGILVIIVSISVVLLQKGIELLVVVRIPQLKQGDEGELPPVFRLVIAGSLWIMGILLILSNIGINVISLVAGLGIGGIAVALAVQNILGDLFSSFALYFDQPFKPGDFIIVGQHMGTVKKVGLKTTRIQALQGEEIVISNRELTDTRIQNFKRMNQRRVAFRFGVTYDTPPEKMRAIPTMVKEIIESFEDVRFDRVHFFNFGDSSLDFEVVYYVLTSVYNRYMDIQQEMYLKILERFAEEEIEFAFPTRTVHVVQSDE